MKENDITFEEVPVAGNDKTSEKGDVPYAVPASEDSSANIMKGPIPGIYENLYLELKKKCDPANFMDPYDPVKVAIANELYSQILDYKEDEAVLKRIRQNAIDKLSIKISTEKLYKELLYECNPKLFIGQRYNKELLDLANQLYPSILKSADDIIALETIKGKARKIYDWHLERKPKDPKPPVLYELIYYLLFFIITILLTSFINFKKQYINGK